MKHVFSEEIFDPGFGLEGPHLVAASAGTGKTYSIQNIYARLVAEKGFRASQIQVMTFTEAATKELRSRVRAVLAGMSRLYADGADAVPDDELSRLSKLRECARASIGGAEADAVARARVELALMEFDQSAISTIHGFCRRALVRFAFETGCAFRAELADGKDDDLSRRVRDWWRCRSPALGNEARGGIELGMLDGFVKALSGKSDWLVDRCEADCPEAFALERAKEIVEAYEADQPFRDAQTFDDLLHGLRSALRSEGMGSVLAARLRDEFKAVVVDEFQDTDPVQYDILRRVFLDPDARPAPALFFVGDPKQAIYSFRGGDIYTYRKAASDPAVAAHTSRLDTNFRSTPRLIDAINALFMDERRPDGSLVHTFGDSFIGYADALRASDRPALVLRDGRDDPSPFRIVEVDDADARDRAVVDAALDVLEEQRENGLTPGDIAILVSSHAAGAVYRDLLRKAGVPAVLQKSGNVFSGVLAMDFRQVLMAMAQTGGRGQVKAALLTRFFSPGAEKLSDETYLADMTGFFGNLGRTWRKKGFEAAFAALESSPACDFRRRLATLPDGERLLADLMQIVDLAEAAAGKIGPSPEALVDWITERICQAGQKGREVDSEEYARQLESEDDALRIMTIHVSKGLEFPVVIVPLSRERRPSTPFFYHDGDLNLHAGLSGDAAAKAGAEADAERMRLLYVAFTRATKRTVVVTLPPDAGSPLGRLFANAMRNGARGASSPVAWSKYERPETPLPSYRPPEKGTAELAEARRPRAYSMLPARGSYSTLVPSAPHGCQTDGGDGAGILALPGGARTGTCWHAILEALPFDATPEVTLAETKRALSLHGLASADEAAFSREAKLVSDMIASVLGYPLASPRGGIFALRDVPLADRFSEWEFDFSSAAAAADTAAIASILREEWADDASKKMFLDVLDGWNRPIPKGFMKGFVDLLFRRDGFYYVVDWKSNRLNGRAADFSAEGVAAEMAREWYFLQYLLYSVALHRFLKETKGAAYSWNDNFGGVRYCFLRGVAAGGEAPVFADRPGERLLERLAASLGLEV